MNKKIESKNENTSFDLGTGKAEFKYAEYKSAAERISEEGIFIEGEKININPKTLYTK